ncbi:MAG: tyrosine--tRNA ligase [Rhodospirillaceae bacterium]|nr:tyrosine--tRNA ligase [Rhodospirillaceae bacterium]MBT3925417.1 tyrosine--tRNA ligase [Rhodospirillaceae bacterium]MBT5037646.1 tyrosine--tRNA ligase [Rhodospirillaceae bacterium]MBT5674440.1 tyrosine--tRNA ligase [Rhodospirillaceae bacterium]MBT5778137.1 tyrosine--tRNA ligase [Rhodospirillaceae bacterium]
MPEFRSEFMRVLHAREFVHQCTDDSALDALAADGVLTAYIGFDCTADSLHVGSLVQIMMLRWLQQTGHKPIVLMGGGTTKIGDPSGRDESRRLLSDAQIAENKAGIQRCFARFLKFGDGPTDAIMVDNADWLDGLEYVPFLRQIGTHFSLNRMLKFDSVRMRLEREQPMTFLEFNYMILQAYDFMELSRREDCSLQMGGSDQWGNIVNGVELARRIDSTSLYGLTTPLITLASGAKMGKTAQGAVWIDESRLSSYDYWQFWRNTDDRDVCRFLRLFTELPLEEIARIEAVEGEELNDAKKLLANLATTMCHGEKAAMDAADTARATFEGSGAGDGLPEVSATESDLKAGIPAFQLIHDAGLSDSRGAARRLIRGGGVRLNDNVIEKEDAAISLADCNADGVIKLSAGKKRHVLVRPS